MTTSILRRATRATVALVAVQGVVLFLAAGTARFWQGWLFLFLQLSTMTATNVHLARHDPALLDRRLRLEETGETDPYQRTLMRGLRIASLILMVTAGIEHRWGSSIPALVSLLSSVVYVAGVCIVVWSMHANTHASSVIEVEPGQSVVRAGPYRFVRHPMYAGFLVLGLATPWVLGSLYAQLALVPMIAVMIARLLAEERWLGEHLPGYAEYLAATPRRLVPGVW